MDQLTFKFPFKTKYDKQDYYISSNNFTAYKLIESWLNWPDKWINIHGPTGCGKTHLSNIIKNKIDFTKIINAKGINDETFLTVDNIKCLIIDNYEQNINEKLLYSFLNHLKQLDIFLVVNSITPMKKMNFNLVDLKSRAQSFVSLEIESPTDELLRVIISKYFSDKQISIDPKVSEYIIKNVDRSYEKVSRFIKEIDDLSLSSGKSININLIKNTIK